MRQLITEFKKLSPVRQAAVVAITGWNLTLSIAAERDIHRRPGDQVRGSKALWRLVCLTNAVGPAIYFRWGRRAVEREEPRVAHASGTLEP